MQKLERNLTYQNAIIDREMQNMRGDDRHKRQATNNDQGYQKKSRRPTNRDLKIIREEDLSSVSNDSNMVKRDAIMGKDPRKSQLYDQYRYQNAKN